MYNDHLSQLGEKSVLNKDLFSPYGRPRGFYHPVVRCTDASRTRQEFLKDSLIGSIMDRFKLTGQLPGINANRHVITDGCAYPDDFQSGMNGVTRISEEKLVDPDTVVESVSDPVASPVATTEKNEVKE